MKRGTRARLGVLAVIAALVGSAAVAVPAQSAVALSTKPLVIVRTADVDKVDPHLATAFQTVQTLGLVYGTLVELAPDLSIAPSLASSWEFSNGNKTLTFKLRKNVKFHNGAVLTSADVKATFERILNPATAAVSRSSFTVITSIETPDASTVVFQLSAPNVQLTDALTSANASILSAADIKAGTVGTKPNGTGPFAWKSWSPGQSVTLAAFKKYWKGAPKLSGVVFRVIPTEASEAAAVIAGSAQMALISDPMVIRGAMVPGLKVKRTSTLAYHALMLNSRKGELKDVNVRLAISCAIDRKDVINTAAFGEGALTGPITSPAYRSDPSARPCPTKDIAKAKRYLAAAGNPNVVLNTIVSKGLYATALAEAQNVQAQLKEIGVTLNLQMLDSATYVSKWLAGDFDAAIALNGGRVDPDNMYRRYFTSKGNLNKVAGYSSATLDELFDKGVETSSPATRKAVYKQISAELENQAVWVWLFTAYDYQIYTPKLVGFTPMANSSLLTLRSASLRK